MQKAMERMQCFQDCVRRHCNDEDYDGGGDIEWFSLTFLMCVQRPTKGILP